MDYINNNTPQHYYGGIVRFLFMVAAVIMLMGLPTVKSYTHLPTLFSVVAILVLGLAAGFTNPKQLWGAVVNAVIALVGFVIFESYSVWAYGHYSATDKFFIVTLALGFIFLFAVYFSVKTVRGLWLEKKEGQTTPTHTPLEDLIQEGDKK